METPEKEYADGGLKSHRVMGLDDDLVSPASTPPNKGTPPFKNRGAATPATSPDPAVNAAVKPEPVQESGGVTGFIKSLVAGTPVDEPSKAASGETPATAQDPASAPASGAKDGSSPYAPALESIAGPADTKATTEDPAGKFGAALDPIADAPAGDGPGGSGYAAGVVSAVSAVAGTAVSTIKQAAGYGTAEESKAASEASPEAALGPEPGVVTPPDLPKAAVVEANPDGTAEIKAAEGVSGPSVTKAAPTPAPAATGEVKPSSGSSKPIVSAFASENSAAPSESKAAEIKEEGAPGAPASAAGVSSPPAPKVAAASTAAETKAPAQPAASPAGQAAPAGQTAKDKDAEKAKSGFCGCCTIS